MRVILLKNITNLGFAGEIKEVKSGFARNWLIPQNLARPANQIDLRSYKNKIDTRKEKQKEIEIKEKTLIEKLQDLTLEIQAKASDQGRIYASVGINEIQNKLKEKGFELERENIIIHEPMKEIGEYQVPLKFMTQKDFLNINIKITPQSN
jgi:large subunit ribosomal protein L9